MCNDDRHRPQCRGISDLSWQPLGPDAAFDELADDLRTRQGRFGRARRREQRGPTMGHRWPRAVARAIAMR